MLPLILLLLQSLCTQFSLIGHSEHAYSRSEWVRVYLAPSVIIHSGNCYSTFLFDWKLYISWIVSDDIGVVLNCFVFHFIRLFFLPCVRLLVYSFRFVHQKSKQRRIFQMVVVAVEKVIGGIYTCVLISSRVWDTRAIMSRHVVLYATVCVCCLKIWNATTTAAR